jgi:high-affinity nickel-transport protein
MAIALGVSALAGQWAVPEWFGTLGAVISIAFLVALGSLNLAAVLRAGPDEMVQPVGLKGRCSATCARFRNPGWWRWSARCLRFPSTPCRKPPSSR